MVTVDVSAASSGGNATVDVQVISASDAALTTDVKVLGSLEEGWKQLFTAGLKAHLEA